MPLCTELPHTPEGNDLPTDSPENSDKTDQGHGKNLLMKKDLQGLRDCMFQRGDECEGMIKVY